MAKLVRQLNNEHVLIDSATAPLLARMRASLSAALGRPIEDGDPELIAAASLLPYFGQGLASADIASKAMLLQFATGEDLEAIGAHYGIARRTLHATMAVRIAVYGPFVAGTYAVSITGEAPDGTLFSYINDAWTVSVDTLIPEFTLTCEATGDAYNGLNELINPSVSVTPSGETAVDGVLEVLSASRGGGPETDDVYASRIHDTLLARTTAGSKAGYEAWVRTLEGVLDCVVTDGSPIDPAADPGVTVFFVGDSVTEADVEAHMYSNTSALLGDPAYVVSRAGAYPAGSVSYSYYISADADDPAALIDTINAAGAAWAESVSYRLGIIDPAEGIKVLFDAGAWGVKCSSDLLDPTTPNAIVFAYYYTTPEAFTFTCKGVSEWI